MILTRQRLCLKPSVIFTEEQTDFIDELDPLNIEARYPSYKERLMKSLTADRCKELIEQTDKLRIWIKSKL